MFAASMEKKLFDFLALPAPLRENMFLGCGHDPRQTGKRISRTNCLQTSFNHHASLIPVYNDCVHQTCS